jgi:hypothetical protein
VTVLAKYQRLEAEGVWRADEDAQRRDVIVSIGDATLTISDLNEAALTHWSLAAVERVNPGERPGVFTPGADAPETLEIADAEMIDALMKVLRAIRRQGRHPGRLRVGLIAGGLALTLGLVLFWLPGALARYAAAIVPEAARVEAGAGLLNEVARLTGAPCRDTSGQAALDRLARRLFPQGATRILVLPSALRGTAHLPGGTILAGRELVEDHETAEILVGALLAEDVRRRETDPFARAVRDTGLFAEIRLLTTGEVPPAALAAHAEAIVGARPTPVAVETLAARFREAEVRPGAFAETLGGDADALVAGTEGLPAAPLLTDSGWIALQQICEG